MFINLEIHKYHMEKKDSKREFRINGKGMKKHGMKAAKKHSDLMKRLANL